MCQNVWTAKFYRNKFQHNELREIKSLVRGLVLTNVETDSTPVVEFHVLTQAGAEADKALRALRREWMPNKLFKLPLRLWTNRTRQP